MLESELRGYSGEEFDEGVENLEGKSRLYCTKVL